MTSQSIEKKGAYMKKAAALIKYCVFTLAVVMIHKSAAASPAPIAHAEVKQMINYQKKKREKICHWYFRKAPPMKMAVF